MTQCPSECPSRELASLEDAIAEATLTLILFSAGGLSDNHDRSITEVIADIVALLLVNMEQHELGDTQLCLARAGAALDRYHMSHAKMETAH